ncbi:MAG: hypothetical protein QOF46_3412, partial [Paraburkholderia sp.]|nr:hypothetical protein [Paraburkholderia sp.]
EGLLLTQPIAANISLGHLRAVSRWCTSRTGLKN